MECGNRLRVGVRAKNLGRHVCRTKLARNIFIEARILLTKNAPKIFPETLEPLFCGSAKTQQNSCQNSHQISLPKIKNHRRAFAGARCVLKTLACRQRCAPAEWNLHEIFCFSHRFWREILVKCSLTHPNPGKRSTENFTPKFHAPNFTTPFAEKNGENFHFCTSAGYQQVRNVGA